MNHNIYNRTIHSVGIEADYVHMNFNHIKTDEADSMIRTTYNEKVITNLCRIRHIKKLNCQYHLCGIYYKSEGNYE